MSAMTDEAQSQFSRNTRTWFAGVSAVFMMCVIAYLVLWGKADNSLHQSALSWSFLGLMAVLAGMGFGALAQYIPSLIGSKEQAK